MFVRSWTWENRKQENKRWNIAGDKVTDFEWEIPLRDNIRSVNIRSHSAPTEGSNAASNITAGAVVGYFVAGPIGGLVGAGIGKNKTKTPTRETYSVSIEYVRSGWMNADVDASELETLQHFLSTGTIPATPLREAKTKLRQLYEDKQQQEAAIQDKTPLIIERMEALKIDGYTVPGTVRKISEELGIGIKAVVGIMKNHPYYNEMPVKRHWRLWDSAYTAKMEKTIKSCRPAGWTTQGNNSADTLFEYVNGIHALKNMGGTTFVTLLDYAIDKGILPKEAAKVKAKR